jgi:murein DD-endopeptidase MepM/ murein hydrolase activator NlpD
MRALRRLLRLLVSLSLLVLSATAVAAAVQADRRAADLQVDIATMRVDLGRAQQGTASRLTVLRRRVEVISHPLHDALIWPVNGAITSPYGPRGCCSFHPGLDIDVPEGADVRAAAAGVVVAAGPEEGYGNRVLVDHGRGLQTMYAHLESVAVREHEAVMSATVLGAAGCTGSCDGVHLHFEVRLHGEPTDPELWLPPPAPGATSLHFFD